MNKTLLVFCLFYDLERKNEFNGNHTIYSLYTYILLNAIKMIFIGECIDTKSVAYGPTSIDSSLGYNDVEIDDLRLPFVDDSKDDVVNDSKQAYEIDASGKEGTVISILYCHIFDNIFHINYMIYIICIFKLFHEQQTKEH